MLQIVVLIKVKNRKKFFEYESVALGQVKHYGGILVSAFKPSMSASQGEDFDEIHILQFPDLSSFEEFKIDAKLASLKYLRAEAISSTAIYFSEHFVNYESRT